MIPLKSEEDLKMLAEAGRILSRIVKELGRSVRAGITTQEIDNLAKDLMSREGVTSAFKGYRNFPAHICTSVNNEIVHGIPSDRRLEEGDILGLDVGINYRDYFSDTAVTIPLGKINPRLKKLLQATRESLALGIRKAQVKNHLFDISQAIQEYVESQGFSVVREFVGHGIGRNLHEEPEIPNFGRKNSGPLLLEGMVFAIEPMVNMGSWEAVIAENGWTALTKDGLPSAHFEHTVAITKNGPQVLTQ